MVKQMKNPWVDIWKDTFLKGYSWEPIKVTAKFNPQDLKESLIKVVDDIINYIEEVNGLYDDVFSGVKINFPLPSYEKVFHYQAQKDDKSFENEFAVTIRRHLGGDYKHRLLTLIRENEKEELEDDV